MIPGETEAALTALRAAGMPKIVAVTSTVGALIAALVLLVEPVDIAIYAFFMVALVPAALVRWATVSYDRDICAKAPELFYDLSEYVRASGSLLKALKRASLGAYGAMSDEICRVLSEVEDEGYDLSTSLEAMAGRVNNAYITKSVTIINEALTSSPDAESVLKMASAEGRLSQKLEAERKAGVSLAIVVMYLTVIVFLIVVSLCISSFVPVSGQLAALSAGGTMATDDTVVTILPYYVLSVSVAVCSGLTIGAMRDNSIFEGMKDAAVLVTAAFLVYRLIVFPGYNLMGVLGV